MAAVEGRGGGLSEGLGALQSGGSLEQGLGQPGTPAGDPSAVDLPTFNTTEFINKVFPTEASLVAMEPLIQRLRNKIRRVDAEIIAAVRQQSSSGSKAKEDLSAAMGAIRELASKIQEIKVKAEASEVMVQEICRDIKKLDYAKKHITATITALNRLAMLVLAVDRLQTLTANRQYRDAAGQLEAVTQLCSHFEAYKDVPKIRELQDKFQSVKQGLKSHIFSDFSSLGTSAVKESGQQMAQLADACLAVDALEPSVREELLHSFCSKELVAYQQTFQGSDVARLEKVERRYAWIKRHLKANEDVWKIFPPAWRVPYLVCMQFCKITRAQLMEILDGARDKPEVATLLQALQRTLEFEDDLAERFGAAKERAGDGDASDLSSSLQEQPGAASSQEPNGTDGQVAREALAAAAASRFSFKGTISSAFEPYLTVYVEAEEATLMGTLDKLVAEETWEAEEGGQTHILASSTQMFLHIRRSFNRCSQLTKNQTLFNLYKVFQKVLRSYVAKLSARLPKAGQGLVAAATSDWQVKVPDKDERVICYIINTAEYCHETAGQLGESIQNRIDAQFADSVDMTEEQDEFSGLITRALSVLVLGMETKLDAELVAMTKVPWASLEAVGDQSEYVNAISGIFSSSLPVLAGLLSPIYFQFFVEKLAASFAPRYYANIFKCKRISGTGAQQMLLDTQAIKTLLLELPSLGGQAVPSTYSKYVAREVGKGEALLKVLLSPEEAIADTYRALLPDGSLGDFQRVLDLKGVKKTDQQPLLDSLSLRVPSNVLTAATLSAPTDIVTPASSQQHGGFLQLQGASGMGQLAGSGMLASAASRDAMIARAAALGRGAMAQSAAAAAAVSSTSAIKRIFQLAESAKDGASKKDNTFRKLFNA